MPEPRRIYSGSTRLMSLLMVVIGVALIVRTALAGGGAIAIGILLGVLFIAAGGARLYLQFRGH